MIQYIPEQSGGGWADLLGNKIASIISAPQRILKKALPAAGGIVGGMFGGPIGSMIGGKAGGMVSGMMGDTPEEQQRKQREMMAQGLY